MRWMRPIRCSIRIGFHGRSKLIMVWQNWRFLPSPPDSVLTSTGISFEKLLIDSSFCNLLNCPWNTVVEISFSRQRCTKTFWVCRKLVKTIIFRSPKAFIRRIKDSPLTNVLTSFPKAISSSNCFSILWSFVLASILFSVGMTAWGLLPASLCNVFKTICELPLTALFVKWLRINLVTPS